LGTERCPAAACGFAISTSSSDNFNAVGIDKAVKAIAADPSIGEERKGDLAGILVHKFKISKQQVSLAYQLHPDKISPLSVLLLNLGTHENFYAELKRLN
jgi:hypothetical protein